MAEKKDKTPLFDRLLSNAKVRKALSYLGVYASFFPAGHYYSPIPHRNKLRQDYDRSISANHYQGIDTNESSQLAYLNTLSRHYMKLPYHNKTDASRYYFENDYFSYSDALILGSIIAEEKPNRILEIGSGYSTAAILDCRDLCGFPLKLESIDPYSDRLEELLKEEDWQSDYFKYRNEDVRNLDLEMFKKLKQGDILFVDSSHISKVGSDVNYLIHQILPILNNGVIIHFHDVFDNFEYPIEWLEEGVYFNEQYLLRSFLQYNNAFEIVLFSDYMEKRHKEWYQEHMPLCLEPHELYTSGTTKGQFMPHILGQSIWLRKR